MDIYVEISNLKFPMIFIYKMNVYNNPANKTAYLDVNVVPVSLCTDQLKYTDSDSHFIHIPREAYHNFLEIKSRNGKADQPLYVGVRNNNERSKRLCFGRVEPSIVTPNSDHNTMLLPEWAMKLLGIDFTGKLDLVYVIQPQPIAYIKVRGNKSTYTKYRDVKAILEVKLSQYNCLNVGEKFTINTDLDGQSDYESSLETNVTFTITELKSKENKDIEFGSIYDVEVNFDFELPEDLVEAEKQRKIDEERAKNEPQRVRILQKATNDTVKSKPIENPFPGQPRTFGARVHTMKDTSEENGNDSKGTETVSEHFSKLDSSHGIKLGVAPAKKLSRDELLALRMKSMMAPKEGSS